MLVMDDFFVSAHQQRANLTHSLFGHKNVKDEGSHNDDGTEQAEKHGSTFCGLFIIQ